MAFSEEEREAQIRIDLQFDSIRRMPTPILRAERYRHGIETVVVGGFLKTGGQTYEVRDLSHYSEKSGSKWYELEMFCIDNGKTVFLEWERDDELEIALNMQPVSMKLVGITPDGVEEMADEESGEIAFLGKKFHYDDDYGATYHRSGRGEGEKVHFYDFETSDEKFCLTVEEWGTDEDGYDYDVYVSEYLTSASIEVLVLGAA